MCTQLGWYEEAYSPNLTSWKLDTMCLNFDAKTHSYSTAEKAVNAGARPNPSLVVVLGLVGASLLFSML